MIGHFLLILQLFTYVAGQNPSCTPRDYSTFTDLTINSTLDPSRFESTSQFLVRDYVFGCEGRVTDWEVYTFGDGPHPVEFTVWRFDSFDGAFFSVYNLVGSNYFADVSPDRDNLLSFSVPPGEQIQVRPGDIPGIRSILFDNTTQSPFQIQAHSFAETVLFYPLERSAVTPLSMSVLNTQPNLATPVLSVTVAESGAAVSPLFTTAPTEAPPTATPTESLPSPSPTSDEPTAFPILQVVIPVVAGVVVMLTTVVAIIAAVTYCYTTSRNKTIQSDHNSSIRMDMNTAYGNRHVQLELDDYESSAYYSVIQDL